MFRYLEYLLTVDLEAVDTTHTALTQPRVEVLRSQPFSCHAAPPAGCGAVRRQRVCSSAALRLVPTGNGTLDHLDDEDVPLPEPIELQEGLFEVRCIEVEAMLVRTALPLPLRPLHSACVCCR